MSKNATFIKIRILNKDVLAYVDTGATLCIAQEKLLPKQYWKKMKSPAHVRIANNKTMQIQYKAVDFVVLIEGRKFLISSIYQRNTGVTMILGNNFLKLYHPFIQRIDTVTLRCPNLQSQKSHLVTTKIYTTPSFVRGEIVKYIFQILERPLLQEVEKILEEICSQDALDPLKNKNTMEVKIVQRVKRIVDVGNVKN